MRLELDEISAEEFAAVEREILARIRELKGVQPAGFTVTAGDKISGVEVESFEEERHG